MTELTEKGKWMISFYSTILLLILLNPFTFKLVNMVTMLVGINIASDSGCPNVVGLLLHGLVFFFLFRLLMVVDLPGIKN